MIDQYPPESISQSDGARIAECICLNLRIHSLSFGICLIGGCFFILVHCALVALGNTSLTNNKINIRLTDTQCCKWGNGCHTINH